MPKEQYCKTFITDNTMQIEQTVNQLRSFFHTGQTLDIQFRIQALKRLQKGLQAHEKDLTDAIRKDLGKSASESYMCEVGLALAEVSYCLRHIKRWAKPKHKCTPLTNFAAKSMVVPEPYGVVLIMSPWNYPVLLTLEPLIGALTAGNCALVKPSAYSPATSQVLADLIKEVFPPEYVSIVTGGRQENQALLDQRFDYIFFTGGVTVGKMVMEKASRHLTPVTLELGGKSPVVIDHTANLRIAARRITFGKFLNCGQTCIAPDYVLVEESVHDRFLQLLQEETEKMYGDALKNENYGKIVNQKHFERISGLIDRKKIYFGGQLKPETLQIAPTVLDKVTAEDPVMQEEIFGPVLPILTVKNIDEACRFIQQREKPLALYLFTSDKATEKRFQREVSFGGGCVNDTIIHIATSNLPFGGVGYSGMGSYHGEETFKTFSHMKSIVKKYTFPDIPMRYQPYGKLKDKLVRLFLH